VGLSDKNLVSPRLFLSWVWRYLSDYAAGDACGRERDASRTRRKCDVMKDMEVHVKKHQGGSASVETEGRG